MSKRKLHSPLRILEQLSQEEKQAQRIFRMDYPVYNLPVIIKERMSEPYESLEWFMMRALAEGNISNKKDLAHLLGLDESSKIFEATLVHLTFIGHIFYQNTSNSDGIAITPLGRESYQLREKVYEVESRKLLYFDALHLEPFERSFYEDKTQYLLSASEQGILRNSHTVDLWDTFAEEKLHALLSYDGKRRNHYNLPQEMNSIQFDFDSLPDEDMLNESGLILFAPLYIVFLASDAEMKATLRKNSLDSLTMEIYSGTNGKRLSFFERLIRSQFIKFEHIWAAVFSKDFKPDDSMKIGEFDYSAFILKENGSLDETGNVSYSIGSLDIERWSRMENVEYVLRFLTHTRVIPIVDRAVGGRLLKLNCDSKEVLNSLLTLLQEYNKQFLQSREYSDSYIKQKNSELQRSFQLTWGI